MTSTGLITALLIYLASSLLILLVCDALLRRWWMGGRKFCMLLLCALLLTPGPSNDSFTLYSPAIIGILFNLLAHTWIGVLRSLAPLCLMFSVLSLFAGLSRSRNEPKNSAVTAFRE